MVGDNLGGGNSWPPRRFATSTSHVQRRQGANFAASRRRVFRYAISAQGCDADGDGNIDSGGWGEIGGNDFIEFNHDGGTIMHELGHTLNLHHGGDVDANCKPNYVSVMNYDQQFGIRQAGGGTILDFSPPAASPGGRGVAPLPPAASRTRSTRIPFSTRPTPQTASSSSTAPETRSRGAA